jgi:hypothetical protein
MLFGDCGRPPVETIECEVCFAIAKLEWGILAVFALYFQPASNFPYHLEFVAPASSVAARPRIPITCASLSPGRSTAR